MPAPRSPPIPEHKCPLGTLSSLSPFPGRLEEAGWSSAEKPELASAEFNEYRNKGTALASEQLSLKILIF